MIHASKYIIHEHKTWATEMAKSATYATLGAVSSFGSGVIDSIFLVRNITRDAKMSRVHQKIAEAINMHIDRTNNNGDLNQKLLQNDKVLSKYLEKVSVEKLGNKTTRNDALNLIKCIRDGKVTKKQLLKTKNLNMSSVRYLRSWSRIAQHSLYVVSIALTITVGVLFITTPPGAVSALVLGLSMGAWGCKIAKFGVELKYSSQIKKKAIKNTEKELVTIVELYKKRVITQIKLFNT